MSLNTCTSEGNFLFSFTDFPVIIYAVPHFFVSFASILSTMFAYLRNCETCKSTEVLDNQYSVLTIPDICEVILSLSLFEFQFIYAQSGKNSVMLHR